MIERVQRYQSNRKIDYPPHSSERAVHSQWSSIYSQIASGLEETLESQRGIFSLDTLLLEPSKKRQPLHWAEPEQYEWLKVNASLNQRLGHHHWCRILVLPRLPFIPYAEERRRELLGTLAYVHFHLWHGIIAGIVFTDSPQRLPNALALADLNFVSVPKARQMFYIPKYYRSSAPSCTSLERSAATDRLQNALSGLGLNERSVIWLYYDQLNFGADPLPTSRWNALRRFFGELYLNNSVCEYCESYYSRRDFDLDHIMPRSANFPQTLINFRPLHSHCNKRKHATLPPVSPFCVPAFVPAHHQIPAVTAAFDSNAEPRIWTRSVRNQIGERHIIKLFGLDEF
jgi:hypothetical protein